MKAAYYEKHGGPEVLTIGELPIPDIGEDEVLVQVAAAGVNPIDRRLRAGELQEYITRTFPVVPGWDLSGKIAKVGEKVTGWKVGDSVVGLAFTWSIQHGSNAEYVPINVSAIAPKPKSLSFLQAAALPLVTLTAWQSLSEFGNLKPGQSVLIQAGAGGLGSVAIPIAKYLGAIVYTTTSKKNTDYVKQLGADHIIDYKNQNYVDYIREYEPDGLDMVLESLLSDETTTAAIRLTKDGGAVAYMNNEPPAMHEIEQRGIRSEFIHHRADGESLAELMLLFEKNILPIPNISAIPLEDIQSAHRQSEAGHTQGKVVLSVQDFDS